MTEYDKAVADGVRYVRGLEQALRSAAICADERGLVKVAVTFLEEIADALKSICEAGEK